MALAASPAVADPSSADAVVQELLARGVSSPQALAAVSSEAGADWVDLLVRGEVSSLDIEILGGQVRTVAGPIRTVHLPVSALAAFMKIAGLEQVQAAQGVTLESDVSVPEIGARALWGGTPPNYPAPPTGNTGRGVVVGLIDSGIDVTHADLRTSTNKTRILWLWDHNLGLTGPPPSPYGYGAEYSASAIDAGQYTGLDNIGHGTHVLSIAAGNGRATGAGQPAYKFVGVAPEADLIVVKLKPLVTGEYSDANIIDAANYIFTKAGTKPTVILCAMGKNTGPHDGQDPLDIGLSALTRAGKLIVTGAGNYGGKSLHSEWTSTAANQTGNITLSIGSYVPALNAGDYFRNEGWYDASANYDVSVVTPNGTVVGPVARGGSTTVPTSQGIVSIKNGQTTSANGSYMVDVYVYRGALSSPQLASGTWTWRFKSVASGTHRVDGWIRAYALGSANPVFVTGKTEVCLLASPASANNVLSAGAYSTKRLWVAVDGNTYAYTGAVLSEIASFSSPGPRRDGVTGPDIAAPGYGVVGAKAVSYMPFTIYIMPDGVHFIDFGTSVAAAHLAGAAALWLGPTPTLTVAQARDKIRLFAFKDSYVGAWPNNDWGYGKLRVAASPTVAVDATQRFGFTMTSSNPARGTVHFRLQLSEEELANAGGRIQLRIYDVRGRVVASMTPALTTGSQSLSWNGSTSLGGRAPSGVYAARVEVGDRHAEFRFVRLD